MNNLLSQNSRAEEGFDYLSSTASTKKKIQFREVTGILSEIFSRNELPHKIPGQ